MLLFLASPYLFFFAFLKVVKNKGANRITNEVGMLVVSRWLLVLHAAGIGLFGLLPFFSPYGHLPVFFRATALPAEPVYLTVMLLLLVLWLSPLLAGKVHLQGALQVLLQPKTPTFYWAVYFLLRLLFIAAYECWFRGFLLMDSVARFGIPVAVCLNIVLYTLLHSVNGKREMLGCIPFGLLLCSLCIWMGQVWPAVLLHLALTISYEITLLQKIKMVQHENFGHRRIGLHRA